MKTLFFLVLFSLCSIARGQYTDTATMRTIEQTSSAVEGDLYLDTNAQVYKIGLTTGKLGLLSDNQSIDSLKVVNDSLFLFISRNDSVGIPLIFLQNNSLSDTGLRYYTWNITNTTQPNILNISNLGLATSQGKTTSPLNDANRISIAPDTDGYIICYSGKIKVKNTGVFTFQSTSNDGARIYIDDVLVLESWFDQNSVTRTNTINLAKGEHTIEFWYYERVGVEFMEFKWGTNPDGYTVGSVIQASQFYIK